MKIEQRLPVALLVLRVGVFVMMLLGTLDKLVRPEHAAEVFAQLYFLGGLGVPTMRAIGAAEAVILLAFLAGYERRLTYGAVLLFHGVATFAAFRQYLRPFADQNLLYFAAWPALAACFALFYLRDFDTLWALDR